MYKITETYTDYDGTKRTEDFYFNLTSAEIMEMEYEVEGGLDAKIHEIINASSTKEVMDVFKFLLQKSYGRKSLDGKRFVKSEEATKEFMQTAAYSKIYTELATSTIKAVDFVNGIVPKETEI